MGAERILGLARLEYLALEASGIARNDGLEWTPRVADD